MVGHAFNSSTWEAPALFTAKLRKSDAEAKSVWCQILASVSPPVFCLCMETHPFYWPGLVVCFSEEDHIPTSPWA